MALNRRFLLAQVKNLRNFLIDQINIITKRDVPSINTMISDINIPFAKIMKPSMEEFQHFDQFVENFDKDKSIQNYGIVKVVPPSKWIGRRAPIDPEFERLVVNSPIEQNVQGKSGVYELFLLQKKSMRLGEYKKKVEVFDNVTKDKSIEEVEQLAQFKFWKNIAFTPPLYGADIPGHSLFDKGCPWNLSELPGILNDGLDVPVSGVNNPYLYVGSWKTMFGWHKEDLDLYSINYNHYGKPKFWYSLPVSESKKLEDFARQHFGEAFAKCKEFIRHKTIMINPYLLKQKIPDLKIHNHRMIQYPGEFVITIGGAYHAGFNWGLNIAEAVNFATTKWLEILPHVGACHCISDSVKFDKTHFFKNVLTRSVWGKLPSVKKLASDYGVTKEELEALELENTESEETMESEKKISRAKKRQSEDSDAMEEEKASPKQRMAMASRKKNKPSEGDEEDDEVLKISARSKKIKKFQGDDDSDKKKTAKKKGGKNSKSTKDEVKELLENEDYDELVIEDWFQCDSCKKWRVVDDGSLKKKQIMFQLKFQKN